MTRELIDKINKIHLLSYTDINIIRTDPTCVRDWEFANIYGCTPHYFNYDSTDEKYLPIYTLAHNAEYDCFESFYNIKREFENDCVSFGAVIFTEYGILSYDNLMLTVPKLPERIKKCLVEEDVAHHFLFASVSSNGFITRPFPVKEINSDILDNYNEDLPNDKFKSFIEEDSSGIGLMFGIPGTGKTHYIRYLISEYPDKDFIWFDQSLLTQATSDSFARFIIDHKHSILILEDCEILLRSRENGSNSIINTVLNIADGIIGDSLDIKFLCTFNTDLTNVDKAITRKGRMKIQYEFKALTKDRVKFLFNKFGIKDSPKEMPLCDIYNYGVENGTKKKEYNKIGF